MDKDRFDAMQYGISEEELVEEFEEAVEHLPDEIGTQIKASFFTFWLDGVKNGDYAGRDLDGKES